MLLLLFSGSGGAAPAAPTGHPGFSTKAQRNRAWQQQMPSDDETALAMLLEAEDSDVSDALLRYESVLRRLLH